jgi:hypothetical protein
VDSNTLWVVVAAFAGGAVLIFELGQQAVRRRRALVDPRARFDLDETYEGLRSNAIGERLENLGLKVRGDGAKAFGLVVDWGLADMVITISALVTGDVALYLSGGGGTFGGTTDQAVRAAGVEAVKRAESAAAAMTRTRKYPLPPPGRAAFYLLMSNRTVLTAEVAIDLLEAGGSDLSPAWSAARRAYDLIVHPAAKTAT